MASMRPSAVEPGLVDLYNQPRRPRFDNASVADKTATRRKVDFVACMDRLARQAEFDIGSQSGGKEGGSVGHGVRAWK